MPVRYVPVYVDEVDSSVYAAFVTSTGLPEINMLKDRYQQYRRCESVMDMGYCVATREQVNALETYISQYGLRNLDKMAFPDGTRRPPVMHKISQNGHDYDVGTVMISPDLAQVFIRRSGGGTVRLVFFSKTPVTQPTTFSHT